MVRLLALAALFMSFGIKGSAALTLNHDFRYSGAIYESAYEDGYIPSKFYMMADWGFSNTISFYREGGGLFAVNSVDLSGSLSTIMKSGSGPNPLVGFNVICCRSDLTPAEQNAINEFVVWQSAGGTGGPLPFFRVEGFRDGNLMQALILSELSEGIRFPVLTFFDRIDFRINLPDDFIFASWVGGGGAPLLRPSSYSCYYGCHTTIMIVENIDLQPVPLPASAGGLLAGLGALLALWRRRHVATT
jgi:hypothetical protein